MVLVQLELYKGHSKFTVVITTFGICVYSTLLFVATYGPA